MSSRLSPPVTVEHEYLRAILLELQAANELLAALIAQGEPVENIVVDTTTIDLREPKKRKG